MMDMLIKSADLNVMVEAVEKAARSLMRDFGEVEQLQVSQKGPADFVSAADKRAESIIHRELSEARPGYGFIMEETGTHKGDSGSPVFVVDPLDGTTNFLHGLPHWCISVALVENGATKAAVIYAPVTNELFYAERGQGAFCDKKKMRVSGKTNIDAATLLEGEYLPHYPWYEQGLTQSKDLRNKGVTLRRFGAAALDLSYVAAGRVEGFWETGIKIWDVAAGILMVEEAKGTVSSMRENKPDPLTSQSIVASNTLLHKDLQSILGYVKD